MDRKLVYRVTGVIVAACFGSSAAVRADETCNSPYISKLIKGQEDCV